MAVIQTTGLSKRYKDKWAVDHLDLRVEQGDIYGFIGQNGAGKSTTLKLLCGLAAPTLGEALLFDRPVRDPVARRRVGALIEQPGLYPDLSGSTPRCWGWTARSGRWARLWRPWAWPRGRKSR